MAIESTSIEDVVGNLCHRLRCSTLAEDLKRLNQARDGLNRLQIMEAFEKTLPPTFLKHHAAKYESDNESINSDNLAHLDTISEMVNEECFEETQNEPYDDEKEDAHNQWQGFYTGFHTIQNYEKYALHDERKCVQLYISQPIEELEFFIRNGTRCFLIDLFVGSNKENQLSIVHLRESELKVSTEFGFPVRTTLVACLSPRLQYVGQLVYPSEEVMLKPADNLTLTTNRRWSAHGSESVIYVNARFLLADVKPCDALFIGCDIQVLVKSTTDEYLQCTVKNGGLLKSRLPVLFPKRCNKFRISLEELEDITFCKEVGIDVLVSYTHGTPEYLKDLQECIALLDCDRLRLGARISVNELKGSDDDYTWIAQAYDMFIFDLRPHKFPEKSEILHLCPSAEKFMQIVYGLKKPVLLDITEIANKTFVLDPDQYTLFFYQPDRYILRSNALISTSYFFTLQSTMFNYLPQIELSEQPYCDKSLTGSDTLARACVTTSIEMNAPLILVCSLTGRMAQKLSHFRPKAQILFISCLSSTADYLSIFWNVTVLYFRMNHTESHRRSTFKHILFGLLYAKARDMVHHLDNVLFIFGHAAGTKFSDEYIVFKYDEQNFVKHLCQTFLEKSPELETLKT